MKTAAIYARVSSDRRKEQETITSQTSALRAYAAEHGYLVPDGCVYEDDGWSGATLIRPGLERVRDLAAQGQIDALLVYSPDRLSRKYAYQVLLLEEFARAGVDVVFVRAPRIETPEEVLLVQFQGMIAEYEKAQISERTRRGKRHRARCGVVNVLSGAPYGYRDIRKAEGEPARYEILEPEATVVREVFHRYTEEASPIGAITRWLTDSGIPTRTGKRQWERSTIWGMLRNPAYQGAAGFQKTAMTPREHVRVTRRLRQRGGVPVHSTSLRDRPREEWIEIPVPALISPTQFAMAQARLAENRRFAARHTKVPSLLQGLLVCRACGYAYYRTSTRTSRRKLFYYRCLGSDDYRYPEGRRCTNRPVRQDALDALIWAEVIRLLENPSLVHQEIDRPAGGVAHGAAHHRETREPDQDVGPDPRSDRAAHRGLSRGTPLAGGVAHTHAASATKRGDDRSAVGGLRGGADGRRDVCDARPESGRVSRQAPRCSPHARARRSPASRQAHPERSAGGSRYPRAQTFHPCSWESSRSGLSIAWEESRPHPGGPLACRMPPASA